MSVFRAKPWQFLWNQKYGVAAGVAALGLGATACSGGVDEPGSETGEVVQAVHVEPILIQGNATCGQLGDWVECKIEPVSSGIYTEPGDFETNSELCAALLELELDVYMTEDGQEFDWKSLNDRGIDAVFVKGGPNGNLYVYDPAATSGEGLHSPLCPSGDWCGISHISFCLEVSVDVSKTAFTSFKRTYEWDIDKSVDPASWDLFTGESGTSDYSVLVSSTGFKDSDFAVYGNITIENNTTIPVYIESVVDELNGITADVDCGVSFPYLLGGGESLVCSYEADLDDGTSLTNTATVTTSPVNANDIPVGGGTATAAVIFGDPTTKVNETVNITDTIADNTRDLGSCSAGDAPCSFPYDKTFTCDGDKGQTDNTATIVETGQNDSASVVVNCYDLDVTKDADASFKRRYFWDITKSGDPTVIIADGTDQIVNYTISVFLADPAFVDLGYAVSGKIEIANNHPTRDADLTAVTDIISPDIAAAVDCPSLTVPAGGTLTCTYSAILPNADSRTNTATATQQLYNFDSNRNATAAGTADYSGNADVIFGDPELIDECVVVSDSNPEFAAVYGAPEVCVGDVSATYNYSVIFNLENDETVCENFKHINTAVAKAVDTGTEVSDDETVICGGTGGGPDGEGCTPGFWQGGKGAQLWDTSPDAQWAEVCGGDPPFVHSTLFNSFFNHPSPPSSLNGLTMFDLVSSGGGSNAVRRAARSLVAAYLNASCGGVSYDLTTKQLEALWKEAVDGEISFSDLHTMLDELNNLGCFID